MVDLFFLALCSVKILTNESHFAGWGCGHGAVRCYLSVGVSEKSKEITLARKFDPTSLSPGSEDVDQVVQIPALYSSAVV